MKIGNIKPVNRLVLAPMAGVTDLPFRILCRQMGCGLAYTEMVSDKGLLYQNVHTLNILKSNENDTPLLVQIFGSEPESMAAAARIGEQAGADGIDINMGCPTPKIVKNGAGAALLRDPELAYTIIRQVVQAVTLPVTVKIRSGWDAKSINALTMARLAEKAGAAALAVHGRTREQFYSGTADWGIIRAVKKIAGIPVIGNGDVYTPAAAAKLLAETGCDGVMVGRAAQGNPWLFKQIDHFFRTGVELPPPSLAERVALLLRHLDMLIESKGEYIGSREMRRHAAWYTKGLPHSAALRLEINGAENKNDFLRIMNKLTENS